MNQILYVQKEKKKGSTVEINKIVMFFSIAIIVFGLVMLGEGVYGSYKNGEMREVIENTTPTIALDREGQQLKISVSHIRELQSLTYNWNNDEDTVMEIDVTSKTSLVQRIELPAGENEFNITAIDVNGKTTNLTKEFYMETGRDITKPVIDISVVGNYIKVVATDETALSYLTYRWNEDEETTIQADVTNSGKIEMNVEILRGKNTITIIAVDSSNNAISREATFEGRVKPTIEVWADGNQLHIVGKHDTGVKQIDYTINGQTYSVQSPVGTEMTAVQTLSSGYNRVSITVYSVEETQETFEGECTINQ